MNSLLQCLIFVLVLVCYNYVSTGFADVVCPKCPDGWVYYNNSCYYYADTRKSDWTEAAHYCLLKKANLVAIESQEENVFLIEYAKRLFRHQNDRDGTNFWTGGTDEIVEGQWRWYHNNEFLIYQNWAPGQPNSHHHTNEDCLVLEGGFDFTWHDISCVTHGYPLCEISLPIQPDFNLIG